MTALPTVPLTQAQLGLWHEEQDSPGGTLNHIAEILDLRGDVNIGRFEAALGLALQDVAALHVRFMEHGGQPAQVQTGEPPRPARQIDLRGQPDPEGEVLRQVQEDLDRPLDLRAGILYRHTLYRLDKDHWQWTLVTHHIALDGYGLTQLLEQLAAHERALDGLHASPAPFGPLAPVAEEDAAYQSGSQRQVDGEALRRLYADLPFEAAPLLTLGLKRGHRAHMDLPFWLVRDLRTHAQLWNCTWPDVLFAAGAAFWHALTGEQTVLIAMPVMLRLGSAAARVPCMRMNLLPLRVMVDPGDTLRSLTCRVQEARQATARAAPYRYEHLWADLAERRLFGPEVNVIPFAAPLEFAPGVHVSRQSLASGPVEDLALTFSAWGDRMHVALDGHPDLYSPGQVDDLLKRLIRQLDTGLRESAQVMA